MLSRGSGSPQLFLLMKNNLVYALQGETYLTQSSASQQVQGSHNLCFGNGDGPAFLTDNLNADPRCRDVVIKDFHLRPDSPARNAGVAVGIATDADGDPRPSGPACAIGAYEL
jgi:hypothetical protein